MEIGNDVYTVPLTPETIQNTQFSRSGIEPGTSRDGDTVKTGVQATRSSKYLYNNQNIILSSIYFISNFVLCTAEYNQLNSKNLLFPIVFKELLTSYSFFECCFSFKLKLLVPTKFTTKHHYFLIKRTTVFHVGHCIYYVSVLIIYLSKQKQPPRIQSRKNTLAQTRSFLLT